jgi:hypothetical protein
MTSPTPPARSRNTLAAQLLVPFPERPVVQRVVGALVVPLLFGALCGVVLGWSSSGYWVMQVIATLGGIAGGFEHQGAASGARRGAVGGLIFGTSVLLGHTLAGTVAEASLGPVPALLPAITTTLGCALGAVGGRRRAAFDKR